MSGENVFARLWSGWTHSHPGADSTSIWLFVGSIFLLPVDNRLNKSTHTYTMERVLFLVAVQNANLSAVLKSIFLIIYKTVNYTTLFSSKTQRFLFSFFFFSRCIRALFYLHINSTDNPLLWRRKPLTEVEVDEAGWGKADTAKKVNYNTLSCNALHISDWLMAFNCVKVTTLCISPLNRTT